MSLVLWVAYQQLAHQCLCHIEWVTFELRDYHGHHQEMYDLLAFCEMYTHTSISLVGNNYLLNHFS